ncbi:MAG: MarR family transcriptional regulator [Candidatus Kapabacteria bacterium]|nr:MarR family transcriptional regulator [Candidatus Kapabacteria bacterium]
MALKDRIKQRSFSSAQQEAMLSILTCADALNRRMEEVIAPYGITGPQYNVLRILRGVHPEGHPRHEITSRMIQQAPDVTRLIDRLIKQGLVVRGKSNEDKRLSLTFITDKGLDLLASIAPTLQQFERHLRNTLSQSDAAALARLSDVLRESL